MDWYAPVVMLSNYLIYIIKINLKIKSIGLRDVKSDQMST